MRVSVTTNERVPSIDVIRGLAIMGIFLINIQYFMMKAGQENLDLSSNDEWIWRTIDMFALGKFHFIFAFLFGVGSCIFLSRLNSKELSVWTYVRRMLLLLLAGFIHGLSGGPDVLITYAMMGLALLLFYRLPLKWIVGWGLFFSFFYDLYAVFYQASLVYSGHVPSIATTINDAIEILLLPKTLGHILLGFAAYRIGLFSREVYTPVIKKGFAVLLILSLAIWGWNLIITDGRLLHRATFQTAIIPGMLYICGVMLFLRTKMGAKMLVPFQAYGRMAFTNYILQTMIGLTVIKAIVTQQPLNAIQALFICLVIYVVQVILSNVWLAYFRFGPFEWLWRCGTYMKIGPIKK